MFSKVYVFAEPETWSIKVSIVFSDCQWLSRVSGGGLLHDLLCGHFNWRCFGFNLGPEALSLSHSSYTSLCGLERYLNLSGEHAVYMAKLL